MTKKSLETGKYIEGHIKRKGFKPTIKQIMKRFGLSSTSSAWERIQRYKNQLEKCPFCGEEITDREIHKKRWWQKINPESKKPTKISWWEMH